MVDEGQVSEISGVMTQTRTLVKETKAFRDIWLLSRSCAGSTVEPIFLILTCLQGVFADAGLFRSC